MHDLTCLEVEDSAPGFALDILPAEQRARVAAHLIRCAPCRQTVSTMQESADDLLDLGATPPWEPAPWPDDEGVVYVRPARRRLRVALSMAAAAMLFVGSTFAPEIGMSSHPDGKPVASAPLLAGDQAVGTVHFYANRADIDLTVDRLPTDGQVMVVVTLSDGTAVSVGRLQVAHGRGAWAGTDPVRTARMTGVAILDAAYRQIASAPAP